MNCKVDEYDKTDSQILVRIRKNKSFSESNDVSLVRVYVFNFYKVTGCARSRLKKRKRRQVKMGAAEVVMA